MLTAFSNKQGGERYTNKVTKSLSHVDFESIWVIGLQNVIEEQYLYVIVRIFSVNYPVLHPILQLSINKN